MLFVVTELVEFYNFDHISMTIKFLQNSHTCLVSFVGLYPTIKMGIQTCIGRSRGPCMTGKSSRMCVNRATCWSIHAH